MEQELKKMMDTMSIADIDKEFGHFIHSAGGYDDRLKLSFVLLNILQDGAEMLKDINSGDFISEVSTRIKEMEKQADELIGEYGTHLEQDSAISDLLTNRTDSRVAQIRQEVERMLSEYDAIIKKLLEVRDKLPIEKQIEQEKA